MKTQHPLLHRTHSMCVLINHPVSSLGERALLRSSSYCPWSLALTSEEHLWFPEWIPPSGTTGLLPNNEASPKHHIRVCTSGRMQRMGGIYPKSRQCFLLYSTFLVGTTKGHQGRRKGHSGREPHHRDPSSQKGLNVDFQGGAGQIQLKFGDNIRMKDTQLANALTPGKDLSTSPGEESGAF